MIYKSKGYITNHMVQVPANARDFELLTYLCKDLEAIKARHKGQDKPVDPEEKKRELPYFVAGELTETKQINGKICYIRNDQSLRYKSLITIDIEATYGKQLPFRETLERLLETLRPYNYIIYPTANNRPENARLRVILEPERHMSKAETKATTLGIIEHLEAHNIFVDHSSANYSQPQGLPVDNGLLDQYEVYTNTSGHKVRVRGKQTYTSPVGASRTSYKSYENARNTLGTFIDKTMEGATEGQRNTWLTSITGSVIASGCDLNNGRALIHFINTHKATPPLQINEVDNIIRSIIKAELRKV